MTVPSVALLVLPGLGVEFVSGKQIEKLLEDCVMMGHGFGSPVFLTIWSKSFCQETEGSSRSTFKFYGTAVIKYNTEGSNSRPMTLTRSHFDRIRRRLEAEGQAAQSFRHGSNRGQIREAFVREFLSQNTSHLTGIGMGEIIHATTTPNEPRNQIDVIIHNNRYPKISMATGVDLFFVETVSSFIEIKSNLKKDHLRAVARTSKAIKSRVDMPPQRFNPTSLVRTPRPYSFLFAYDGPSRIQTVVQWMKDLSLEDEYNLDRLKTTRAEERAFFTHLFIDGVFILGRGYAYVDALPWESRLLGAVREGRHVPEGTIWGYSEKNELPVLWVLVNVLSEIYLWNNFNMAGYLGAIEDFMTD